VEPASLLPEGSGGGDAAEFGILRPELLVTFADGAIVLTDAGSRRSFKVTGQTLSVLAAAADTSGVERKTLEGRYGTAAVHEALWQLAHAGLMSTEPGADAGLPWRDWGPCTWQFHQLSSDVRYMLTREEIDAAAERRACTPPPPISKCGCAEHLTTGLPQPRGTLGPPLSEVLLARRTCRAFTGAPITVQQLADVLFYTGGWLHREHVPHVGPVFKKCVPSPGARHTIEIYPIVNGCRDVEPGVYHYCVEHHRLVRISDRDPQQLADAALLQQTYFSQAPVVFLLTCIPERLMWKYKTPRAYRHAHLEAGHYCQNLVLTATALGLGAFQTGAIADTEIQERLGIDGHSEFAIYAAGVGHRCAAEPADWTVEISPRLAELGTIG
jgi:SagB-type dehydrogenase family enzyme